MSTLPLEAKRPTGALAPIDLSLQRTTGGVGTTNSLAPFRVDPLSAASVGFRDQDVSLRVHGGQRHTVQTANDRAFFANVLPDSDVSVMALPDGVEMSVLVRSPHAPERIVLDVTLPDGARLRQAIARDPIPGDPPRSLEIVRGKKTLGYIHPPIAIDADGEAVAATMSLDGHDVVLNVSHRDRDVHYPVNLDPEIRLYSDRYADWLGWGWTQNRGGGGSFGATKNDCAYYCGLYQSVPTNTTLTNGSYAQWYYTSPANSYIYRATFGGISHNPLNAFGQNHTRSYMGLLNGTATAWESNVNYINQAGVSGPNPYGPNSGAYYGLEHDFCFNPRCDPKAAAATERNSAIFGFQAQNAFGGTAISSGPYKGTNTMAWASVYLGDRRPPSLTLAMPPSHEWSDEVAGTVHTVTVGSHDDGLRVYGVGLDGAASGGGLVRHGCLGHVARSPCPADWSHAIAYTLNEGISTLTGYGQDAVDNRTPAAPGTWIEKIDRSKPKDIVLSGSAWDARTQPDDDGGLSGGLFDGAATLNVSAADDQSGVASIELQVNGRRLRPDHLQPASCTTSGCPRTMTRSFELLQSELPQGDYPVTVIVKDQLADRPGVDASRHTETSSFELYSEGPTERTDASADSAEDPGEGPADTTAATTCDTGPADLSCLLDPTAPLVVAAQAEQQVEDVVDSLLMAGDSLLDVVIPPSGATPRSAAASGCPLGDPITRKVSVAVGRRFGMSDQSGYADWRDRGGPDTFSDPRAASLRLQRARIVVSYDLVTRARAQHSPTAQGCTDYLGAYKWIKNAIDASPQREPLVSFEHARRPQGNKVRPGPTAYRDAIEAFMQQFPAVRVFTAWNEPNLKDIQPTAGTASDLTKSGAYAAGRYWRAANSLCERGRRCLVAAGDFLDDASFNQTYRSQYFKGMGSPNRVGVWAYHPYGAIKYGPTSKQGDRLTRFLASDLTTGSQIWLTEAGAFANQGSGDDASKLAEQSSDLSRFLNSANSQFKNAKVKRFYYYEWYGAKGFDTALVGNGAQPSGTPGASGATAPIRPVYCIYKIKTNPASPC